MIDGVVESLQPAPSYDAEAAAGRELVAIAQEIARLSEAIAMGGELKPLMTALQARHVRQAELLALRRPLQHASPISRRGIEGTIRERLTDWRALLTRNVQDGRSLLRQLLTGPLKFTPENGGYRFEGEAAIGRILGDAGLATLMASPTGFEPVF